MISPWTTILNSRTYDKVHGFGSVLEHHGYDAQVCLSLDIANPAHSPDEEDGDHTEHSILKVISATYALAELAATEPEKWESIAHEYNITEDKIIILGEDSGERLDGTLDTDLFDLDGIDPEMVNPEAFPGANFKPVYEACGGIQEYNSRFIEYKNKIGHPIQFVNESVVAGFHVDLNQLIATWKNYDTLEKKNPKEAYKKRMEDISAIVRHSVIASEKKLVLGILDKPQPQEPALKLEHVRTPILREAEKDETPRSCYEVRGYQINIGPRQAALRSILDRFEVQKENKLKAITPEFNVRIFQDGAVYGNRSDSRLLRERFRDLGFNALTPLKYRLADAPHTTREYDGFFGVHAYVLMPPPPEATKDKDLLSMAEHALMLCRSPNLKRIEPRCKELITVVYDPDGRWKPYVDFMDSLVAKGLTSNCVVRFKDDDHISELPRFPFVYLVETETALEKVLLESRKRLKPSGHHYRPKHHGSVPRVNSERFKVAIFAGHNVESPRLESEGYYIGNMLALNNMDMVHGLGDRSVMGAIYNGFVDGQDDFKTKYPHVLKKDIPQVHGSITDFLMSVETKSRALLPKAKTAYLAPDMSHRKRFFWKNGDVFALMPGTAHGGCEEFLEGLMLMKNDDPIMREKYIIVLDRPEFNGRQGHTHDSILKLFFGDDYRANIEKIAQKHRVHIVSSKEEMMATFSSLREQYRQENQYIASLENISKAQNTTGEHNHL